MKWEFSSMMTVSLMLILIPFTSLFEDAILENWWINLFPGIVFLIVGFVGGILTETEYKKALLMVGISYVIIGVFTLSAITVGCSVPGADGCYYFNVTLLGIPIGIVLTSIGLIVGYKLKVFRESKATDLE